MPQFASLGVYRRAFRQRLNEGQSWDQLHEYYNQLKQAAPPVDHPAAEDMHVVQAPEEVAAIANDDAQNQPSVPLYSGIQDPDSIAQVDTGCHPFAQNHTAAEGHPEYHVVVEGHLAAEDKHHFQAPDMVAVRASDVARPSASHGLVNQLEDRVSPKKIPSIDFSQFDDIPKIKTALNPLTLYESPPRTCKRQHALTPQKTQRSLSQSKGPSVSLR